jgi:murein DD-endopeptidase MepM/ murein hydrolase activator NlpD
LGVRLAVKPYENKSGIFPGKVTGVPLRPGKNRRTLKIVSALVILFALSIVVGAALGKISANKGSDGLWGVLNVDGDSVSGSGGPLEDWDESPGVQKAAINEQLKRLSYSITDTDNMYTALQCFGVPEGRIIEWCDLSKETYDLARLKPGQTFNLYQNDDKEFVRFEFNINEHERLLIQKADEGFAASRELYNVPEDQLDTFKSNGPSPVWVDDDTGNMHFRGIVADNFYTSALDSGMSPSKTMALIKVFGTVNFSRDIKSGDNFNIIVGPGEKKNEEGPLLAAMIETNGKPQYIFRYQEGKNVYYYNESGKSTKTSKFLCPLKYTRISSGYTKKRFHPILRKYRPHLGIDYAAPIGTPVKASASGKIVQAGWRKGYGKTITIKHNNSYKSQYAHLSSYAKGIKSGKKVKQGQLIGYVGSTGLSTGPHLDYRIYKKGKAVNPLRVTTMPGPAVQNKKSFNNLKETMIAELGRELPLGPPRPFHSEDVKAAANFDKDQQNN